MKEGEVEIAEVDYIIWSSMKLMSELFQYFCLSLSFLSNYSLNFDFSCVHFGRNLQVLFGRIYRFYLVESKGLIWKKLKVLLRQGKGKS